MNPPESRPASAEIPSEGSVASRLCLRCGLCCNGVLFGDVRVVDEDKPEKLLKLGLPLQHTEGTWHFDQPCKAHSCAGCGIYSDRPAYCAEFNCALLQDVLRGRRDEAEAGRIIDRAKRLAESVDEMLAARGETDKTLSLSRRYQSFMARHEGEEGAPEFRKRHGELTVAVMSLNQVMKLSFYT
ncbi:MAG: Fe-S-cluster containining protein [Candidatus Binatia bacterium]|jgi:Fe-S-cluster containining protein